MKTFALDLTDEVTDVDYAVRIDVYDDNRDSEVLWSEEGFSVADGMDRLLATLDASGYAIDDHTLTFSTYTGMFLLKVEQPLPEEVTRTDVVKAMGSIGIDMSPERNSIAIVDLQSGDITVSPKGIDDMNQVTIEVKDV